MRQRRIRTVGFAMKQQQMAPTVVPDDLLHAQAFAGLRGLDILNRSNHTSLLCSNLDAGS